MFTLKTRFTVVTLAGVLVGCGSGYGSTAAPPPPANTVAATDGLAFTPATLQVSAGDIVRFTVGSVAHNVAGTRSEEHTSELQSRPHLVCRLLLDKNRRLQHHPTAMTAVYDCI